MKYNVAFISVEGVNYWSSWPNKEAFEQWIARLSKEDRKLFSVLEEGISVERCIELKRKTPLVSLIAKAIRDGDADLLAQLQEQNPSSFVEG